MDNLNLGLLVDWPNPGFLLASIPFRLERAVGMNKQFFSSEVQRMVEELLRAHPILRDDHSRLLANVWHRECKRDGLSEKEVLALLAAHKISAAETVSRWSRKLQEDIPALRGKNWLKRTRNRQQDVKQELGYE